MVSSIYYYPHLVYVYLRYFAESIKPLKDTHDIDQVFQNIFVGNISTAYNKKLLKDKGITHIVSAISGMKPVFPNDFKYLTVDLIDTNQQEIVPSFDETNHFIEDALNSGGKVYVHCMCGVSRSVSIICAYYAYKNGMNPNETLEAIKAIRSVANPNPSFMEQLQNYHYNLVNENNENIGVLDIKQDNESK